MPAKTTPDQKTPDPQTKSGQNSAQAGVLDPMLLELLVCPQTGGPLTYDRAGGVLISKSAGLAYPVRDGIPIMLIDEAEPWEQA